MNWTAMRRLARILYPLRRNRIAVLGARSAPKRYWPTSQGLCQDIKGRAHGWFCSALILALLIAARPAAQDVYLRLPADLPVNNPLAGDAEAIQAGMGIFRVRCADCHGMDARGIRGPDITQVWARGRTDDALFRTIRHGAPDTEMPAFPLPRTSDLDIWRILAYLKTMATPAPTEAPRGNSSAGESVFTANCLGCHRVNGRGGRLGPDLSRIGAARTRTALARQIRGTVDDVRAGYEPVVLTTSGGEQIQGVKKNEDLFSVQIMDTRERIQGYLREDMRTVASPQAQPMPAFAADRLSDAELDDLLAYLTSLGGAPPSSGNR